MVRKVGVHNNHEVPRTKIQPVNVCCPAEKLLEELHLLENAGGVTPDQASLREV